MQKNSGVSSLKIFFFVFVLLVCELHVHTDCILFACSDCRQCHQDGHLDHVSAKASVGEGGRVFCGVEKEQSWSLVSHAACYQSTLVAYWQAEDLCDFGIYFKEWGEL